MFLRRPLDTDSNMPTPFFMRRWPRAVTLWLVVAIVNLVGDYLIYVFLVHGTSASVCAVTSTIPLFPHLEGTDALPMWWNAFRAFTPCDVTFPDAQAFSQSDFEVAVTLAALATTVCAGPLIWFLVHTWFVRYDEFCNSLKDGALRAYLERFWARRLIGELLTRKLISRQVAEESDELSVSWLKAAEANPLVCKQVFESIYRAQYGLGAFLTPFALLIAISFVAACLVAHMRGCMATGTVCSNMFFASEAPVAVSATAGAFLFAVGDSIRCIRQRCMTVSDSFWYALRLLLAIPIGLAVARAADPTVAQTALAFGFATFPLNDFLKVIRRFAFPHVFVNDKDEDVDKLLALAGVTLPIAAVITAEGIFSIEQLAAIDPVVLSVRTGLPFRFLLSLGSQAVIRWHFGPEASEKLAKIGLNNALSIREIVCALDAPGTHGLKVKAPEAVIQSAVKQLGGIEGGGFDATLIEMKFREIAAEGYTRFLAHIAPAEPAAGEAVAPAPPQMRLAAEGR